VGISQSVLGEQGFEDLRLVASGGSEVGKEGGKSVVGFLVADLKGERRVVAEGRLVFRFGD
jgi:hypothetical protein